MASAFLRVQVRLRYAWRDWLVMSRYRLRDSHESLVDPAGPLGLGMFRPAHRRKKRSDPCGGDLTRQCDLLDPARARRQ